MTHLEGAQLQTVSFGSFQKLFSRNFFAVQKSSFLQAPQVNNKTMFVSLSEQNV